MTTWNASGNPTDYHYTHRTYTSAAFKNGYMHTLLAGAWNLVSYFSAPASGPAPGTWNYAATNLWTTTDGGTDIVHDRDHDYLWVLTSKVPTSSDAGTNIRRSTNFAGPNITWYDPGATYDGPAFRLGGTDTSIGVGAALAWVPARGSRSERLYVVNRNGTQTRGGRLY